jgi:hypothetical protein
VNPPCNTKRAGKDGINVNANSAEFLEERTVAKGNSKQESAVTQTQCWGETLTEYVKQQDRISTLSILILNSVLRHVPEAGAVALVVQVRICTGGSGKPEFLP